MEDADDPYDFNTVSSVVSGLRRTWDPSLTAVIEDKLQNLDKMPTKKELLRRFMDNDILKHVLHREGEERCYEKVKNVFKRRAKE